MEVPVVFPTQRATATLVPVQSTAQCGFNVAQGQRTVAAAGSLGLDRVLDAGIGTGFGEGIGAGVGATKLVTRRCRDATVGLHAHSGSGQLVRRRREFIESVTLMDIF